MAVWYKVIYHVIELQVVEQHFIQGLLESSGTQETKPEILKAYADQFTGTGTLSGEYERKIDESVTQQYNHKGKHFLNPRYYIIIPPDQEQSKWLTTFNIPFSRFKIARLPFGLVSTPDVFQRAMTTMFENVDTCEVGIQYTQHAKTKCYIRKATTCDMKCLKKAVNKNRRDRIRNEDI